MIPLLPDTGLINFNTAIWVALITAIPGTLVALLALVQIFRSKKAIQEVHLSINSRMDELLKSARGEAKAQGKEEGRQELK